MNIMYFFQSLSTLLRLVEIPNVISKGFCLNFIGGWMIKEHGFFGIGLDVLKKSRGRQERALCLNWGSRGRFLGFLPLKVALTLNYWQLLYLISIKIEINNDKLPNILTPSQTPKYPCTVPKLIPLQVFLGFGIKNIFIDMRKFSRTNPQNKSMINLHQLRVSTDPDEVDSLSSLSIKGGTQNFQNSGITNQEFGRNLSSILLAAALLRNSKRKVQDSFGKLRENVSKQNLKKKKLRVIFTIDSRASLALRRIAFNKLKAHSFMDKLRKRGCLLLDNSIKSVMKRYKRDMILQLIQNVKAGLHYEIKTLKEMEQKYNENSLPAEDMSQLRKFQKINTKNVKVYQQHSEQILKPSLERIVSDLQQRRRKKQIKSDSEIIATISLNQDTLIADIATNLSKIQEQAKNSQHAHTQTKKQISVLSQQKNQILADLKKWDTDLDQKNDGVIKNPNPNPKKAFKPLLKSLEVQIDLCAKKPKENYFYQSRLKLLLIILNHVQRYIDAQNEEDQFSLPLSSPKKPPLKNLHSAISERNSVEESGIIEEVIRDLNRIINEHSSTLSKSTKSATAHMKSDSLGEMMSIKEMISDVQEILKIQKGEIKNLEEQVEKLEEVTHSTVQKNAQEGEKTELDKKIKEMEALIHQLELSKERQVSALQKKLEEEQASIINQSIGQKNQELQKALQQRQLRINNLEKSVEEKDQKIRQIEQQLASMNNEKNEAEDIVTKAKEQYKRFKEAFRVHSKQAKDRQKTVKDMITPKANKTLQNSMISFRSGGNHGQMTSRMGSFNSKSSSKLMMFSPKLEKNEQQYENRIKELREKVYDLRQEIASKDLQIKQLSKPLAAITVNESC